MCVQGVINSKFRKKNDWITSIESFEKSYYELEYALSLDFMAPQRNTDESFLCVVKHKDDGQTKFIKPISQSQDRIIKYWVSIGSIHREQG